MKISFNDIRDEGKHVEGDLSEVWVQTMLEDLEKVKAFEFSGDVSRMDKASLHFRAAFKGVFDVSCDRCLETFPLSVSQKNVDCLIQKKGALASSKDAEDDESSTHWVNDWVFELTPILKEYVVLALPFKRICKETCQGLCQNCGQNLNLGDCGCPEDTEDKPAHPFQALKGFRENKGR